MNIESIREKLEKFDQEQLLAFYDELNSEEKESLLQALSKIDYSFMRDLYVNSYTDEVLEPSKISSLKYVDAADVIRDEDCRNFGEKIVKDGSYAIVILAGGNGSRLGFKGPKGCLELDMKGKKISLFEIFMSQLIKYASASGVYIDIFFMTSRRNNEAVVGYFEEKEYFGYPKENIHFFVQGEIPIMDTNGKLLLESKSKVLYGPNGNGNVFSSLKNSGMLDLINGKGIKYVLFTSVDDVMNDLIDFSFIGAVAKGGYPIGSKSLFKEDPNGKDWIFCKYDGRPFILPSAYITDDMRVAKDEEGRFLYRDKNVLYHLISTQDINTFASIAMPYHRAYKKNAHIDKNGNLYIPENPNTFKFEQFIFDVLNYGSDMFLCRIEKKDFCPIKTKEDVEIAKKRLEQER